MVRIARPGYSMLDFVEAARIELRGVGLSAKGKSPRQLFDMLDERDLLEQIPRAEEAKPTAAR
jgi:hypothetical protein